MHVKQNIIWIQGFSSLKYLSITESRVTPAFVCEILENGPQIEHFEIDNDSSAPFELKDWERMRVVGTNLKSFIMSEDSCEFNDGAGIDELVDYIKHLLPDLLVFIYDRTQMLPENRNVEEFKYFVRDVAPFGTPLEDLFSPRNFCKDPTEVNGRKYQVLDRSSHS